MSGTTRKLVRAYGPWEEGTALTIDPEEVKDAVLVDPGRFETLEKGKYFVKASSKSKKGGRRASAE